MVPTLTTMESPMLRAGMAAVHEALAIQPKAEKSENGETTASSKTEVKVHWHFFCEDNFMLQQWVRDTAKHFLLLSPFQH